VPEVVAREARTAMVLKGWTAIQPVIPPMEAVANATVGVTVRREGGDWEDMFGGGEGEGEEGEDGGVVGLLLREVWVRGERARVVFVAKKNKGHSRKGEPASWT